MDANFFVVFIAAALASVTPSSSTLQPYDLLYEDAVRAFSSGDYGGVVRIMEEALSSYSVVRRSKIRCRLRCQDQHPFADADSDLGFFGVVLRRASCMDKCIEQDIGVQSMHKVSEDVVQDFNRRIPYNYLQLAYLKADAEVPKAFVSRCFCMQMLRSELCPHFTLDAEVIFSAFFTFPELYFPHEIHVFGWDVVDHSAWEQSDARIKQDEKATKCNLKCSLRETGNRVWITKGSCLLHHCVVILK